MKEGKLKFKMPSIVALSLALIRIPVNTDSYSLPRPSSFVGSERLLDGYLDDAQHFIDVFTLPKQHVMLQGSASDVSTALRDLDTTGLVADINVDFTPCHSTNYY